MKKTIGILIGLAWCLLLSCTPDKQDDGQFYVVATTGMIADAVKNIAGPEIKVDGLMGPGVDPHLYKAKPSDLGKLRQADIIFYNGIHLEGKMGEVLETLGKQKPVVAIGDVLPASLLMEVDSAAATYDPHIWFDVSLWKQAVSEVEKGLSEQLPEKSAMFKENAANYLNQLEELHNWVKTKMATIPGESRVLVTAHDAFGYFGRAYETEVRGLQGISTVSEPGLADVQELVDFIVNRKIKAVFVESSVPEKLLEAVVKGCIEKGHNVQIGGTLYSDAMGAAGTPEGTYLGMVKYNVNTITEGLLGEK